MKGGCLIHPPELRNWGLYGAVVGTGRAKPLAYFPALLPMLIERSIGANLIMYVDVIVNQTEYQYGV